MKIMRYVGATLALILAISLALYGKKQYEQQVSTTTLPVPVTEIPPYTVLTSDMFTVQEMPQTVKQLPYYREIEDLVGMMSAATLFPGVPVAIPYAGDVEQVRLAPSEFEVVSLPIIPEAIVGGNISLGDIVNIYYLTDDQNMSVADAEKADVEGVAQLVAANVRIVDLRTKQGNPTQRVQLDENDTPIVGSSSSSTSNEKTTINIVTFALLPEDVKVVLDAFSDADVLGGGQLWLTLATP